MILLPSCQAATAATSARHSCGFTGHVKKKCCISASVQKDKADELLGHSRLFLILNMHSNTVFWQLNRGAGANTRWGSGTKCYRKYGRAAQSTTRTEAFGRWAMTLLKDSSNADCSSSCDATRCGSTTEDVHLKWEGKYHPCQFHTQKSDSTFWAEGTENWGKYW